MKNLPRRQLILLIPLLLVAITACISRPGSAPAATDEQINSDHIVATVLAEIEPDLALAPVNESPTSQDDALEPAEAASSEAGPEIDIDAIVATVVARVEEQLAQQQEEVPVVYSDGATAAAAEEDEQTLQTSLVELYRRANPAVVYIIVPPIGSGSGFVFGEEGYIVTNNHVVDGGTDFEVVFAGGQRQRAELVGSDVDSDLAVIQVEDLPEEVEPLPLAASEGFEVGQFVIAIGNPFGEQGSMSLGIVSGLGRSLSSQRETNTGSSYSLPGVIQTDAPINPGNSGGPLLNLDGEVVGVNSAIRTTTGTNSGVGFSIPVGAVRRIVPSLIEDGAYVYPYMGASFDDELSLADQDDYGVSLTQGAYVVGVTAGGPADEAGLIPADRTTGRGGDLIIAMDGRPIGDFEDLNSYLVFNATAGQSIMLTVSRAGETIEFPLTLGARP